MEYIKCNICNKENEQNSHYCNNCGKNLSNNIEKTDVLFFFRNVLIVLGIIMLYITPGLLFFDIIRALDGGFAYTFTIISLTISLTLFAISYVIKKYALKLCEKNINN